ncbi:retrovirus-related pol polyprotein from transposon TNT 1-94 [Tanacetum coccineum]
MSNTNTYLQTKTSNALHNAIIEAGDKDHPPMLAPCNYLHWKSKIKRYIDTKPNNELTYYCLQNPPYKFKWTEKTIPIAEGSSETTTEGCIKNYKNVSQDINNQLDAEAVQIILTGIDNDIYSIVDACPNACEMWKAIERLKHGESINPEWQRFVTLVKQSQELKTVSYHKLYDILKRHQNEVNKIRAERLACTANPLAHATRNRGKAIINSLSQTYDQEPKMAADDDALSKENEIDKLVALISLSFKKIYKPTNNNLRTSSNTSRAQQNNTSRINRGTGYDNQRVVNVAGARENVGDTSITIDSLDMSPNRETVNQDDDDLARERDLLASLIDKLKYEIDDIKTRNKLLESSNKTLFDKLKGEIEDFKTKNKILESSNNHFKEANNELSKTNQLMIKDLKKFQAKLDRYHDVNYASKMEIDCAKAKGDLIAFKINTTSKSFEALQQDAINLELALQQCQEQIKNDKAFKENQSKVFLKEHEQYFEIQDLKAQLQDKGIAISELKKVIEKLRGKSVETMFEKPSVIRQPITFKSQRQSILGVISNTGVSRPQLKSNQLEDRVMHNNSQGKKQQVEDHRRNFKFSNNKTSVTVCNDILNAKTLNETLTKYPIALPISTREPKRTVNQSVATPLKRNVAAESTNQKPRRTIRKQYEQINKTCKWWYSKITPPGYKWKPKTSTVNVKPNIFLFIVDFRCSKHMTGYIKLLSNFVEKFLGLNHNLFSVGQFYDADLEVAFQKSACYIRDLKGNDLLTGSRSTDLYSITLQDTSTPNPIFLMAKATSSQAWLWHHHRSHLNFDTINLLLKYNIVTGLPKLKFLKDHLCSSCELGKQNIYLDSLLEIQRRNTRKGIEHQTSTARTTKQNGVVERRNRTLVEAARTMLSATKVPLFFWAKAIATTCFTQNHLLIIPGHEKTPYHIINGWKPSVKFLHIFCSLCYIVRDGKNLNKMKEKGDACIFVGYSTQSRAYMVYNKRTRVIVETIHANFDELSLIALDLVSFDPVPQCSKTVLEQGSLSLGPQSQENVPQAAKTVTMSNELDLLFSLMFDVLLNRTTTVVSKPSVVTAVDALNQRKKQNPSTLTFVAADTPPLINKTTPATINQAPTQAPTIIAIKNINQAEINTENAQVEEHKFINIFSTPVQDREETSSRYVNSSNMHTFYQRHPSEHGWTKDHPLE